MQIGKYDSFEKIMTFDNHFKYLSNFKSTPYVRPIEYLLSFLSKTYNKVH